MKKIILFLIFTIFLILITTPLAFLSWLSSETNKPLIYFPAQLLHSLRTPTLLPDSNIILLGLDKRDDWLEKTTTTDTIIMINLNSDGSLKLVPLPRDLWDYQINSKINNIYPLSEKQINKFSYIENNYQRIFGQPISRTVILTTQNLKDIVRILNGIEVYLESGFKDELYPNPEYILHPGPNVPLYKTVEFSPGKQILNSENITEFIRSRKASDDPNLGTDLARIKRQQLVVDSLIKKIKSFSSTEDIYSLINLYKYFGRYIETNITDQDIISFLISYRKNIDSLNVKKINIPTGDDSGTDIIFHPLHFINEQWVFTTHQNNFSDLHQYIKIQLYGSE